MIVVYSLEMMMNNNNILYKKEDLSTLPYKHFIKLGVPTARVWKYKKWDNNQRKNVF